MAPDGLICQKNILTTSFGDNNNTFDLRKTII